MWEGDKENIVRGIGTVLGGIILDRVATKGGIWAKTCRKRERVLYKLVGDRHSRQREQLSVKTFGFTLNEMKSYLNEQSS